MNDIDTFIICVFNVNDLQSTGFDAAHLYLLFKDICKYNNITIITDNSDICMKIYVKEQERLYNKEILSKRYRLPKIVNIGSKHELFESINNLTINSRKTLFVLSSHGYTGTYGNINSESDKSNEYIRINNEIINDDELHKLISNIKSDFIILTDTCSSATMFDLPWICKKVQNGYEFIKENNNICLNNIICISACNDFSYDPETISEYYGFGGNLISNFLDHCYINKELNINNLIQFIFNSTQFIVSTSHNKLKL